MTEILSSDKSLDMNKTLLSALAFLLLGGCAGMQKKNIETAVADGNLEKLNVYCSGQQRGAYAARVRPENQKLACESIVKIHMTKIDEAKTAGDKETVAQYCLGRVEHTRVKGDNPIQGHGCQTALEMASESVAERGCDEFNADHARGIGYLYKSTKDEKLTKNASKAFSQRLVACEKWEELFFSYPRSGIPVDVAFIENGTDVDAKILAYMKEKPNAANDLYRLRDVNGGVDCTTFATGPVSRRKILIFSESCPAQARKDALAALASDSESTRIAACDALGKVGTKGDLSKLSIMWRDPSYKVTAACQNAEKKIKLKD